MLASRRRTAGCTSVACACTALAGCCLLTSPEPDVSVSAVTIIGGADGPTAILVTGAAVGNLFWYLIPVVLLLLGILLLVLGCRRKR